MWGLWRILQIERGDALCLLSLKVRDIQGGGTRWNTGYNHSWYYTDVFRCTKVFTCLQNFKCEMLYTTTHHPCNKKWKWFVLHILKSYGMNLSYAEEFFNLRNWALFYKVAFFSYSGVQPRNFLIMTSWYDIE